MVKRSLVVLFSMFTLLFTGVATLSPAAVSAADPKDEVCAGIGAASGSGNSCDAGVSLTGIIRNIINIFSVIIGIVAVIMIMVAGFKYITAGGDSGNITSAKNTLIYAIVGLVVAALSQIIVRFVLANIT